MTRSARRAMLALALALAASPAAAADLSITKTSSVVADNVNALNPKALPGATVDYAITVTDPLLNGVLPIKVVAAVTIVDAVPANTSLRVADYGAAGSGPVEFADGSLLGTGLLASGVGYSFASLASMADGVDFSSDGVTWTYVPTPDANGYDARVKAIRVRLTGTQVAGTAFRLRFRVKLT
ncbi:hypothetical protein [Sphingomonas bacterium]|uniref:hypothetical protein n=1 Tax=Sphingomonas bacterium TaxID=1895847 RepID=UPI0015753E95|nr:hypothetical protein [Sphingomonas bacterium]